MIVRDKTNSFALLFAWRGTILPKVFPALMVGVLISTLLVYLATQHYVTAPAVPVIGFYCIWCDSFDFLKLSKYSVL